MSTEPAPTPTDTPANTGGNGKVPMDVVAGSPGESGGTTGGSIGDTTEVQWVAKPWYNRWLHCRTSRRHAGGAPLRRDGFGWHRRYGLGVWWPGWRWRRSTYLACGQEVLAYRRGPEGPAETTHCRLAAHLWATLPRASARYRRLRDCGFNANLSV